MAAIQSRFRYRRVVLTIVLAALVMAWLISMRIWIGFGYASSSMDCGLNLTIWRGFILLDVATSNIMNAPWPWHYGLNWYYDVPKLHPPFRLWFSFATGKGYGILAVPLWFPASVCTFLLALACRKDSRKNGGTLCRHCSYDRSGLEVSSPCPECGR